MVEHEHDCRLIVGNARAHDHHLAWGTSSGNSALARCTSSEHLGVHFLGLLLTNPELLLRLEEETGEGQRAATAGSISLDARTPGCRNISIKGLMT
jgi:hypothetical protein